MCFESGEREMNCFNTFYCFIIGVIIVLGTIRPAQGDEGRPVPNELIENVAAFEKMYDDIEFDAKYAMIWDNESMQFGPSEYFYASIDDTIHIIYQRRKYRFESKRTSKNLKGETTSGSEIVACDGSKTISLIDGKLSNVVDKRVETPSLLFPHSLFRHREFFYFPLSLYLRGKDVLKDHPYGGRYGNHHDYKLEYLGEDVQQGLKCVKIRDTVIRKSEEGDKVICFSYLWLATDRSYLPLLDIGYNVDVSTTKPVQLYRVNRFEEIAPGLWFPSESRLQIYSNMNNPDEIIHASDETYTFNNIRLHPRPPSIVFEKIDIPEDAYIYHIKDGKIVESEQKDVKPRTPRRISPIALYLLIGAPAIAIVAYLIYRFKPRNPIKIHPD
jgi:hypothetical protein